MSAKLQSREGNQVVLTIEVDAEQFEKGLDLAFKQVVKKVQAPGFRKGKMPRGMFEQRFGVEALFEEAIDALLPEAYANAIVELGLEPVDRPEIDVTELERGKGFTFTATVTVKPEVALGEYKGLEVTPVLTHVTDDEVATEVQALQERHAELVVKEDAIVEGDTAVIDFEGFLNDVAFEGGKGENYPLEIGSGQFIPGFEEQLVGAKTGDTVDVNVTFPEEYHSEELAGQPALFKVTIHEVKAKQLPELDDEFAKDVRDDVESLDELKAKLRAELEATRKEEAEVTVKDELIGKVVEASTIEVPEAMISTELERMLKEFEQRLQQQGLNLELYFQFSGQSKEELEEQMKEEAELRVRTSLVLEAVAKAENLTATEEDVTAELAKMSEVYNIPAEEIRGLLNLEGLKHDLQVRKAIDFLVDNSKVAQA